MNSDLHNKSQNHIENETFKSVKYFEALLKYSNTLIVAWDTNLEILLFNAAFEKLTGYSKNEIIGKKLSLLFPEETKSDSLEKINQGTNYQLLEQIEIPILCKNKDIKYVLWNSARIYGEDNSTHVSTIAQGNNITDRKKTELFPSESEETMRIAQKIAHFGSFEWDVTNNKTTCSEEMCLIFEMSNITEEKIRNIFHPDDLKILDSAMQKIFNREGGEIIEYRIIKKNNVICYISSFSKASYDKNGKLIRLIGTVQDISERKKYEAELLEAKLKAEESDRLKSAFLQNISHEIFTPLNAILGFSDLLKVNDYINEKRNEYIDIINTSGQQLLSIIHDIVEISKIETNQLKIIKNKTNVNIILDDVFSCYELRLKEKNIAFLVSKGISGNESIIFTDENKLQKILLNLIGNAFKYTESGSIEMGYRLIPENYLEFYVKDTGIGIDKKYNEEIFKHFRRIEEANNPRMRGTGLGLSISKAFIQLLGGSIWFESEIGKGTTFNFTIPYEQACINR